MFLASCQEQISLTKCWSTAGGLPEVITQSCHTEVPHTLSQTQCDTTIAHKMHLIKNKDTNKSCNQGRTPDCMFIFYCVFFHIESQFYTTNVLISYLYGMLSMTSHAEMKADKIDQWLPIPISGANLPKRC